ncbi:MAG: STAS domain-containing protein [Acidimicrobiia bacterium]
MSDVLDRDHEGKLFRTRLVVGEGTARLTVLGEIDLAVREAFRDVLDYAIDSSVDAVEVDLAGVEYLDSSGCQCLVAAYRRAAARGLSLQVVEMSDAVQRILALTGLLDMLTTGR